jgi:SpoVK/Ycf46/Vps4 family AAA+-type ATPase
MARADQLKALLRAYASNEETQFYSVALQMAADEAHRGHIKLANELRDLVDAAKARSVRSVGPRAVPIAQPRGELAELLTVQYPQQHLTQMVVSQEVTAKLKRVLNEQRQQARLSGHGLKPRRKLLLVGPPGTGKTLTASVLAAELKLITKFMGESASKLRLVFEALKSTRGVYLFDEFDSLGLQRGSQHDVAEMRRTLNMFLQLMEQDTSDSILVAATNHGASLDSALFRRFDDVVLYGTPDREMAVLLLKNSLAAMADAGLDYAALGDAAQGLSQADIVRAAQDAMKDAVLQHRENVAFADVMAHLDERKASTNLA